MTGAKPAFLFMNSTNNTSDIGALAKEEKVVLSILEEIEKNPATSQRKIAGELGMAVGLVNALLKRVVAKGFVKIKRLNSKNGRYLLTSHGLYEKSRLTYLYLKNSIQYVWRYRNEVHDLLEPLAKKGITKTVIYGSGEEAELAFLAMQELGMSIEAIIDPDSNKEKCLGLPVYGMEWFESHQEVFVLLILYSQSEKNRRNKLNKYIKDHNCTIHNTLCVNL